jgi:queuine tRNA-ribosyltransferase
MTSLNAFTISAVDGRARAALLQSGHGRLETPLFAPVGTQATVKAVTPAQLKDAGASLVLANTYHLFLRPGADLVEEMGGLHEFMQWPNPILTDSGGYQVFSLAATRKVDEDGVTFTSHVDGSRYRFTPEISIEIQEKLGADIIMTFDECADPGERVYAEKAMQRTHAWAERCKKAHTRKDQMLFGIVQGGVFEDLRIQSAQFISALDFPGYAIGGLSVGETKRQTHAMLKVMDRVLSEGKPRYLMGVGSPEDLIHAIGLGVDLFDCVLPTRLARHQAAFTPAGRINMLNAVHAHDPLPIDDSCSCYTCQHFSRAYLRHLVVAKEMLAATLLSIHNIHFLVNLVQQARLAILEHRYESFASMFLKKWKPSPKYHPIQEDPR